MNPRGLDVGGGEAGVEFGGDADECAENGSDRWLEVAVVEGLDEDERDEEGDDEVEDGGGVVFEAVVDVPVVDESVEEFVVDIPSAVSGSGGVSWA